MFKTKTQLLKNSRFLRSCLLVFLLGNAVFYAGAEDTFSVNDNYVLIFQNSTVNRLKVTQNDIIPSSCNPSISVAVTSVHGVETVDGLDILYTPANGFIGKDSVTYSLTCDADRGLAKIYINVVSRPDNVSNAHCFSEPEAVTFNVREVARTAPVVSTVTNPICGDIDGDGEIEILVMNLIPSATHIYRSYANAILIYGFNSVSNELYLKYEISVLLNDNLTFSPLAIAKVDSNPYASIFYASSMYGTLTKYDFDGTNYMETWTVSYTKNGHYAVVSPTIADMMGNGHTQVCILDKVFDTRTGTLLANGGFISDTGYLSSYSFGRFGHGNTLGPVPACAFESIMVAVDIDDDGIKELIGGDCVYAVNLTNFDGIAGNSFTLKQRAQKTGRPEIGDGGTAIADIDNDGQLEVIVSGPYADGFNTANRGMLYVYNPRTGEVIHTNRIGNIPRNQRVFGPSRPFVGDVDGDGYPEICLTGEFVLQNYKYNIGTKTLDLVWSLPTSDFSASTTLTMFDFAQDGKARLVYRDQESLRIIDASTNPPTIEARVEEIYSPTVNEFPIVADINGDGAAEIILTGSPFKDWNEKSNWAGELRIYASDGRPWAPARSVWNQSAYNVLNVNEDLTIPSNSLNPATVFPSKDGILGTSDDVRPFNNFLQQQTVLNRNGNPLWVIPDYELQKGWKIRENADRSATVDFCVKNIGNATGTTPFLVSLYKNRRDAANVLATKSFDVVPAVGEEICYDLTVSDFDKIDAVKFILSVNDNGKADYIIPECDYTNNPLDVSYAENDSTEVISCGSVNVTIPVLLNDSILSHNDCPDPVVTILTRPALSGAEVTIVNNELNYRIIRVVEYPVLRSFTATWKDSIQYEVSCGTEKGRAWAYIFIQRGDQNTIKLDVDPEKSVLCVHGEPLKLTATVSYSEIPEIDIIWSWSPALSAQENTAWYVPSRVGTDSVVVTATDRISKCAGSGTFYVTVQDSSLITISPDNQYVCQDGEQEIILTAKVETGNPSGIIWYDGDRTLIQPDRTSSKWDVIPLDSESIYWAYAVDPVCGDSPYAYTTVYVTNKVYLLLKADATNVQIGDKVVLTVIPTNDEHGIYRWYDASTGELLGETTANTFTYTLDKAESYAFYVLTDNGYCPEAESKVVGVKIVDYFIIPNIITPYNHNNLNDSFMTPREGRPGYKVEIYNRYQQKVFEGDNGWDGTYRGQLAEPGTYYYRLFMKDGRMLKGTVEVAKF